MIRPSAATITALHRTLPPTNFSLFAHPQQGAGKQGAIFFGLRQGSRVRVNKVEVVAVSLGKQTLHRRVRRNFSKAVHPR